MSEVISSKRAVWQSEIAKSYECQTCHCWIRTQNEADGMTVTVLECNGPSGDHIIEFVKLDVILR